MKSLSNLWLLGVGVLLAGTAPAAAQERVVMRRLADTVAIRTGPERSEHVLYYFAPDTELTVGDEVEQGSSGHSEILLSGGGHVELHGDAHAIIEQLDPEADVLRFPRMTLGRVTAGERLVISLLPGGVTCRMKQTEMQVSTEPGRIRVRNRGGLPIEVKGTVSIERGAMGLGQLLVGQGQEVSLPLIDLVPEPPGSIRETWSELSVRHNGGFRVDPTGDDLLLRTSLDPEAPVNDVLLVGGVRTRLDEGSLQLSNHRRPVARPLDILAILERLPDAPDQLTPESIGELLMRYDSRELLKVAQMIEAEIQAEKAARRDARREEEEATEPEDNEP